MATTKKTPVEVNDGITVVVPPKEAGPDVPRVRIMIPLPPETDSGLKVDMYEHVTINGEKPVYIKRGEWVDVTVPVYMQLRNRYPNI
jgi:hypothetical protein